MGHLFLPGLQEGGREDDGDPAKIAEQRIREAMERGEFDNLPFHGKPIKLDALTGVPEHLRMGYKILKNAGVLPEELQLKKEIVSLKTLLEACYDGVRKTDSAAENE